MRCITLRFTPAMLLLAGLCSTAAAGVWMPDMFQHMVAEREDGLTADPVASALPQDRDVAIETVNMQPWRVIDPTFTSMGAQRGDSGPDVALVARDGSALRLHGVLHPTLPTLFVSVSVTCPIARAHVAEAEELAAQLDGQVDVRLVYVVEAHPFENPSPYTSVVWPSEENDADGIRYNQPMTIGQRIALAAELKRRTDTQLPMLIDGPDNGWWNSYGPAPNHAVLIAPDGVVIYKQGWFDAAQFIEKAEVDDLLS